MKRRMFLCVAAVCAAAIPAMGQAASGAKTGNKAGGAGQAVGRRQHEPLRLVQAVSQGPNGQLKCTQTNGSACTDAQLSAVIEVAEETAAASKTKNKGGGGFHVMKSIDVASP